MKDGDVVWSEFKVSGALRAKDEEPLELYQGTYRCYASNPLGTAITQVVKVIVESESHIHRNDTHKHTNTIYIYYSQPETHMLIHRCHMNKML